MSDAEKREEFQVLMVCTGNVCRSPMAEYLLRHKLGGDTRWQVKSAGVYAMEGNPASHEAILALDEKGLDLTPHRSSELSKALIDASTLVVVMTDQHRASVLNSFPEAEGRVHLLTSFGPSNEAPDISDPIGGSISFYRTIRDQIDSAISDLVLHLREQWGL